MTMSYFMNKKIIELKSELRDKNNRIKDLEKLLNENVLLIEENAENIECEWGAEAVLKERELIEKSKKLLKKTDPAKDRP